MGEAFLLWLALTEVNQRERREVDDLLLPLLLLPVAVTLGAPFLVGCAVRQAGARRLEAFVAGLAAALVLVWVWFLVNPWITVLVAFIAGLVGLLLVSTYARREVLREERERAAEDYYYDDFS